MKNIFRPNKKLRYHEELLEFLEWYLDEEHGEDINDVIALFEKGEW